MTNAEFVEKLILAWDEGYLSGRNDPLGRGMRANPYRATARATCGCGHPERDHVQFSGSSARGSCGNALCECKKYQKGPGSKVPGPR